MKKSIICLMFVCMACDVFAGVNVTRDNFADVEVTKEIKETVDSITASVCEVLEVTLSNFDCQIVVVKDVDRIKEIAKDRYRLLIPRVPSFYEPETKTLYISAEDYNMYIMAHELTHAIISQYFVVIMPEKMQEILAGYVEYELRKNKLN